MSFRQAKADDVGFSNERSRIAVLRLILETRLRSPALCKLLFLATTPCLVACFFPTPNDHYRPPGHSDVSISAPTADDVIAFNGVGMGGRDLYLLDLNSLTVERVAETPEYETAPSFSPDGLRIAYSAGVIGDRADHIFVIGRDGTSKVQLTDADANDVTPRFSPDGRTIVFARDETYEWGGLAANWGLGGVLCLIGSDGTNLRKITFGNEFAFAPFFNAEGTHVVYSTPNGRRSIRVDGSNPPQSVAGPARSVPSHDGKWLAYSRGKYSPDHRLFVSRFDGTEEFLLTPQHGGCFKPVFAKSGDRLFFLREEWPRGPSGSPEFSLWESPVNGIGPRFIADRHLFNAPLRWKPHEATTD